jgi:Zn-dependent peptidase ImmA (M78 family)
MAKNEKHSCRVCSVSYTIQPKEKLGLADGCFGTCDNNRELIEFEKSQTKDQLFRTIIHELLHAVCHQTSLALADEELTVSQITAGIFSIVEDPRNKPVIDWLVSLRQSADPDSNK